MHEDPSPAAPDVGPTEPAPTGVRFPSATTADENGVVCIGEDFRPGTLLTAYRAGIFPWPQTIRRQVRPLRPIPRSASPRRVVHEAKETVVLWFSPDPRAIFPLGPEPHWSRTLRRTLRQAPFRVTVNTAFPQVMEACGSTRPEGTWISPSLCAGYAELHRLGHAHSVEVWDGEELVGGIYGVQVGAAFAGESMFHTRTDASKIAFAHLVQRLRRGGFKLFDVQVLNPHLVSLGCVELPRNDFLEALAAAHARKATILF